MGAVRGRCPCSTASSSNSRVWCSVCWPHHAAVPMLALGLAAPPEPVAMPFVPHAARIAERPSAPAGHACVAEEIPSREAGLRQPAQQRRIDDGLVGHSSSSCSDLRSGRLDRERVLGEPRQADLLARGGRRLRTEVLHVHGQLGAAGRLDLVLVAHADVGGYPQQTGDAVRTGWRLDVDRRDRDLLGPDPDLDGLRDARGNPLGRQLDRLAGGEPNRRRPVLARRSPRPAGSRRPGTPPRTRSRGSRRRARARRAARSCRAASPRGDPTSSWLPPGRASRR